MFYKLLIANRGEIACRIMRTAKKLGIRCVVIYSEADAHAEHVKQADEAYFIGSSPAAESYLNQAKILTIAKKAAVQAIHPGYGFLSENPEFAQACLQEGICFIGPSPQSILAMGSKSAAKNLMQSANIPVVPGYHGENQTPKKLGIEANKIGYPLLIKAVAGGGGKGMRVVENAKDFQGALAAAKREAFSAFGSEAMILEKYLVAPRHIEIQIVADNAGNIIHLFERDCSIQRRHQKIIEETPAPHFSKVLRKKMTQAAISVAKAVNYVGAGTVEFLLEGDQFYFMEMNTRLQVEHPITEKITGIDLVEWQLRIANGESLPGLQSEILLNGHAIEARIYAEDPRHDFLPTTGEIYFLKNPQENTHIRLDTGITMGNRVTPYYDGMISKLIAWGETRSAAIQYLEQALNSYQLIGLITNLDFLKRVIQQTGFKQGKIDTQFIPKHMNALLALNKIPDLAVIAAATYTMLDYNRNAQLHAAKTEDPYSPWSLYDAWRLNSVSQKKLKFLCHGLPIEVNLSCFSPTQFTVFLKEKKYSLQARLFEQKVSMHLFKKEYLIDVIPYENKLHVMLPDETFIFEPEISYLVEHHLHYGTHLKAPLPGTVVALLVKEGDIVEAGKSLMIIEAMKMEHTVRAPSRGLVKKWYFCVGDLVKEGVELLAFEPM